MLPNPAMQGPPPGMGPGGTVPVGPGPKASPEGEGSPEQVKQQLKMLLTKVKEIAEQNGIDFSEVVAEVEGSKIKSDVPLPRPPTPQY